MENSLIKMGRKGGEEAGGWVFGAFEVHGGGGHSY